MKRFKMQSGKSKRHFSSAAGVHPKNNMSSAIMRGGIRLT